MGSGLTPKQKRLIKELYDISSVIGMDYWEIEEYPKESRTSILELQKRQAITGRIIMQYTLIDDMVGSEICKYFFGSDKNSIQWWRSKKFQNFNYYILEKLSLLEKLRLVQSLCGISENIVRDVEKLNALRNVVAHSFFPENLKKYKTRRKAVYKGKDIFTLEGIELFMEDMHRVYEFFLNRLL